MSDMDELVEDVTEVAEGVLSLGKQKLYAIAGMLSAICGFIGDVLQPIAPFAVYLLIGSTVLLGLSVLFYLKTKKGLVTAVIMLSSTLVLGIVTGIQKLYSKGSKRLKRIQLRLRVALMKSKQIQIQL